MTKTRALLLALAAFVIGAAAGGWAVSRFWDRLNNDLSLGPLGAEASTTVRTLERLRAGNATGAVELLEIKLDGALVGLGAFMRETPPSNRDPLHLKVLSMARDYRARFPRTHDSPEVARSIARAFTLLDEPSQP